MHRDRQPGLWTWINLHGLALDRTREFIFRLTFWQVLKASNEESRIFTVDDSNRTSLALVPILLGNDRSVASLMIELNRDLVLGVDLDPIDRGIHPIAIGIAHDH